MPHDADAFIVQSGNIVNTENIHRQATRARIAKRNFDAGTTHFDTGGGCEGMEQRPKTVGHEKAYYARLQKRHEEKTDAILRSDKSELTRGEKLGLVGNNPTSTISR